MDSAPCGRVEREFDGLLESFQGSDRAEVTFALRATPIIDMEKMHFRSTEAANQPKSEAIGHLSDLLEQDLADSTRSNYLSQWKQFCIWTSHLGVSALPADPLHVATYLTELVSGRGHKPATLYVTVAAIGFIHRVLGMEDPSNSSEVKRAIKGAFRSSEGSQRQAKALTAEGLAKIRATACKPRRGRGGRMESARTAHLRGRKDVAMISLMRDAMLRVSEAAALVWSDIEAQVDGTGRLLIRRSKTDPSGMGAVAFVSFQTMNALSSIRLGAVDTDSIFGLRPNQISKRIKQAAQTAGLGDDFSGHSPRVGMARDLARTGAELPSLMTAGRWKSPRMPALYTRNESAGKGAVAQYYDALHNVR